MVVEHHGRGDRRRRRQEDPAHHRRARGQRRRAGRVQQLRHQRRADGSGRRDERRRRRSGARRSPCRGTGGRDVLAVASSRPAGGARLLPGRRHAGVHQAAQQLQRRPRRSSRRSTPRCWASRRRDVDSHEKFAGKHGFKFPLLADTDKTGRRPRTARSARSASRGAACSSSTPTASSATPTGPSPGSPSVRSSELVDVLQGLRPRIHPRCASALLVVVRVFVRRCRRCPAVEIDLPVLGHRSRAHPMRLRRGRRSRALARARGVSLGVIRTPPSDAAAAAPGRAARASWRR